MKNKKILLVMPIKQSTVLRGFSRALTYLGWEYRVFDYRNLNIPEKLAKILGNEKLATRLMNQRLISIATSWQPKLIFVVKGSIISPESIAEIKQKRISTVNWFPDDIQAYALAKQTALSYDIFCHFDSFAVRKIKKDTGKKDVYHFPFAADILPTDKKPNIFGRRKYNLTLVGNYYPVRESILPVIQNMGLNIWGEKRWCTTTLKNNYHGELPFKDLFAILRQTKIGVNIQYPSPSWSLVNRAYDVMSCGALLLTENKKEANTKFDAGRELVIFKNKDDLVEKAECYLRNARLRQMIAEKGYEAVRSKYTYVHQFRKFFTTLTSL